MALENWSSIQPEVKWAGPIQRVQILRAMFPDKKMLGPRIAESVSDLQRHILEGVWETQARALAQKFARTLDMSQREYIASLPRIANQPEEFYGRFDMPVIVQPPTEQLPLSKMLRILKMRTPILEPDDIVSYRSSQTPSEPYIAWLNDYTGNLGRPFQYSREFPEPGARLATVADGLALAIHYPDFLKRNRDIHVGLAGSDLDFRYKLYLWTAMQPPELGATLLDSVELAQHTGILLAGIQIPIPVHTGA